MKLGKDEIQKIALGVLLLFGVLYSYRDLLLGPLRKRQETVMRSIAALGPEVTNARAQIEKTRKMEESAEAAVLIARQVDAMIPDGSPVAWFPTRMGDFFKKHGIDKVQTRMNGEVPDKELPGFRKLIWGVDLPRVEFVSFAQAIAALENEEPLIEVSALQLDASREDVESQRALITVTNLVKQ